MRKLKGIKLHCTVLSRVYPMGKYLVCCDNKGKLRILRETRVGLLIRGCITQFAILQVTPGGHPPRDDHHDRFYSNTV